MSRICGMASMRLYKPLLIYNFFTWLSQWMVRSILLAFNHLRLYSFYSGTFTCAIWRKTLISRRDSTFELITLEHLYVGTPL